MNSITQNHDVPGGWTEREVTLGDRTLRLATPREPDEFVYHLETLPPEERDQTDVYWAQVWSAANDMLQFVIREPWPAGATALELGCGLGLVGMAAAVAGLRVTFSDYVPLAVDLAVENARRNGLPGVDGLVLDWRSPPDRRFDVLLASDVLYYARFHDALRTAILRLLAPGGVCWIGDSGRPQALDFVSRARDDFDVRLFDARRQPLSQPTVGRFFLARLAAAVTR